MREMNWERVRQRQMRARAEEMGWQGGERVRVRLHQLALDLEQGSGRTLLEEKLHLEEMRQLEEMQQLKVATWRGKPKGELQVMVRGMEVTVRVTVMVRGMEVMARVTVMVRGMGAKGMAKGMEEAGQVGSGEAIGYLQSAS